MVLACTRKGVRRPGLLKPLQIPKRGLFSGHAFGWFLVLGLGLLDTSWVTSDKGPSNSHSSPRKWLGELLVPTDQLVQGVWSPNSVKLLPFPQALECCWVLSLMQHTALPQKCVLRTGWVQDTTVPPLLSHHTTSAGWAHPSHSPHQALSPSFSL